MPPRLVQFGLVHWFGATKHTLFTASVACRDACGIVIAYRLPE